MRFDVHHSKWDHLFEMASAQAGLFTTQQAVEAGYSTQLLRHHVLGGRVRRVRHGIYRIVHFPSSDMEEMTVIWLWSDQAGIISHQTALALHGLSDVLPTQLHLTLPSDWNRRRFRVPPGVVLHYEDVSKDERSWFGPVPTTSVRQTLNDCARASLSPELLIQATKQALRRGLVTTAEIADVKKALKEFGGIAK